MKKAINTANIVNESSAIFDELFITLKKRELDSLASELKEQINNAQQEEKISVAFVGQYSSGKSSIISALTGNKAIKIGSDVTTDTVENYNWGSFLLTDTPGLQNNDTHDERADYAIKHSDLIVYCITSELFSQNTLKDFKNLAFTKGYKNKMVLLINKINSEFTTDIDALLKTYENQLTKDVLPYQLDEIPYYFIDAKDYLDGKNDNDEELISESRFKDFEKFLNKYLKENGLICKLTTPMLTAKQIINNALVDTSETEDEKAKRIAYARLTKTIDNHKAKTSREWDYIVSEELYSMIHQQFELMDRIGEEDFDPELESKEISDKSLKLLNDRLQDFIEMSEESFSENMSETLDSEVCKYCFATDQATASVINSSYKEKSGKSSAINDAINKGGKFAESVSTKIKPEQIYNAVKNIGHKFGHKFKPYEILKTADKLGKVLKGLGPALEIFSLAMDIKETVDENKAAKNLLEARKNMRSEIKASADEIRVNYNNLKSDFLTELYNPYITEIKNLTEAMDKELKDNTGFNECLNNIKNQIDGLFNSIVE